LANFKQFLGLRHRNRHLQLLGGGGGRSSLRRRSVSLRFVKAALVLVLELELALQFSEFSLVLVRLHLLQLPKHLDNRHRDSLGEPTDCSESFLNLPHFWARKQLLGPTVAFLAV
jgi:hypothetical protein